MKVVRQKGGACMNVEAEGTLGIESPHSALHRCSPDQMRRPVLVNDDRVEAFKSYHI